MFAESLRTICAGVQGALAATVMGMDGLAVDTHEIEPEGEVDVSSLLIEYSTLISQVRRSAQMFAAGQLEELSIRSEHLTTIIRPVNQDYFLALAVRADGNLGKGRYLLRIHAPKLAKELS